MSRIKWKCPPKLVLDPGWHVACGEESSEVETQKNRETTVIEAVYSHILAIPPSPLISPDMEGKHDDDSQIPIIPLVPIEEAGEIRMPFDISAPVKTFNCHSTSESLTHSRFNSSVPPNPPTGERSLLNVLHGLEGSDLAVAAGAAAAVAAAMESKHEIDTELLIKFLADPEMMKTLMNETGIGANSGSRFPSGRMELQVQTNPDLSSNPTPGPGISIFVPVTMNQPIPIKESASDLGVTPAKRAHICLPNLVKNWSPAPPRSNSHPPLIQDLTNEAREPVIAHPRTHGTTGTNEPRPLTSPTTLRINENHYARLADPEMVKTLVNETGIGANSEPRFPSRSKSTTYPLSSVSTPDPGIDIFGPVPMNQPIFIKESASDLGVTPAKRARICSPNLVNNQSPAPLRSNSHPSLIQDLINEASEPAIALSRTPGTTSTNEPEPLSAPITLSYNENHYMTLVNQYGVPNAAPLSPFYPSISKPNWEGASKPVDKHPPPFFNGIKSVCSPPPFSSTSRPYMHCMTDRYQALDHAPWLGSNPSMPSALELNFTSTDTFYSHPFPSMNKLPSPVEGIYYCKSLIKQHGEKHIRNEDKLPKYGQPFEHLHELELAKQTNPSQINATFQKPCMFFNSSKGCRRGPNCQYMHVMSRR